ERKAGRLDEVSDDRPMILRTGTDLDDLLAREREQLALAIHGDGVGLLQRDLAQQFSTRRVEDLDALEGEAIHGRLAADVLQGSHAPAPAALRVNGAAAEVDADAHAPGLPLVGPLLDDAQPHRPRLHLAAEIDVAVDVARRRVGQPKAVAVADVAALLRVR